MCTSDTHIYVHENGCLHCRSSNIFTRLSDFIKKKIEYIMCFCNKNQFILKRISLFGYNYAKRIFFFSLRK